MITFPYGDLLTAPDDAIVNPVNCVGVSGSGLALHFKETYPDNFELYEEACQKGQLFPGNLFVVTTEFLAFPKWIVNFPTKRHFEDKSRLEDIEAGLIVLNQWAAYHEVKTVALPRLGCGLGGLSWASVLPLIKQHLKGDTDWHVYSLYN
jgi:O-acetyl-ADP-ribose deacetylase (regulator of RNase III)